MPVNIKPGTACRPGLINLFPKEYEQRWSAAWLVSVTNTNSSFQDHSPELSPILYIYIYIYILLDVFCVLYCWAFWPFILYFDEPVGLVKIQTTNKNTHRCYTPKRKINDLLSNWFFFCHFFLFISHKAEKVKRIEKRSTRSRLVKQDFFTVQNNQLSK